MPIEEVPLRPVSTGPLTFGSCSNPIKLNDRVIGLWARTLAAVPEARLVLKYRDAFSDPDLVDGLRRRFAGHGIARSRLVFDGRRTERDRHLETVGGFDIAFDTFPFNGCTTTYEALWMGVPVVTPMGKRFLGRMSASMLHQIGLDDLAAESEEAFVAAVAGLAADSSRRDRLRRELRGRLRSSPLLDAAAYAHAVEGVYRTLWQDWCRKQGGSRRSPEIGGL
ncbi:MAG: hypothetical protein EB034_14015 [Verrucomicrobia bacterium]|nr:hypothetical protein [Verrucomicrobiota bacterium]